MRGETVRVSRTASSSWPDAARSGSRSSNVTGMGAALVLLLVGLGAMAAGVLIGRYYVPDDRQLRRTAKHSRAYMRAVTHLIARDHETVVDELRTVVD